MRLLDIDFLQLAPQRQPFFQDQGRFEPRNELEVALCNDLEQAVIARVALPEGEPPVGGWPGVVVLHGSSGLFSDGGASGGMGICAG